MQESVEYNAYNTVVDRCRCICSKIFTSLRRSGVLVRWYGGSLADYFVREFCHGGMAFEDMNVPYIPLWSDILG